MIRLILYIFFFSSITGCNFDHERQYNLRFPVTLVLKNNTKEELTINKIVNSLDAKSGFVLLGNTISKDKLYSLKISEDIYEDILAGNFILWGICAGEKEWKSVGTTLARKATYNEKEWNVTVSISSCGGS